MIYGYNPLCIVKYLKYMNFHSGDLWLSRDMPGVPIPQYLSCRCLEIEGAASLEPQEQEAASLLS